MKPVLLAIGSLLCLIGMWTYAGRVLVQHQKNDAVLHRRPRGNVSDLYPRWLGARELLLRGRDPYSPEITREIQTGFYGRPLDPSQPDDPLDEERFAYPVYVVFFLAPTIRLPFALVQTIFYWTLLFLTCLSTLLWLRVQRSAAPFWARMCCVALTLALPAVMQGLNLRQMSLLVAGLLAMAIALLTAGYPTAAGVLLAFASIKPQLVFLLLAWLFLWVAADWRRRYQLAVSYMVSMAVLIAAAEWYLPHWIPRFLQAVHEYRRYTRAQPMIEMLVGTPWSWVIEALALAALMAVCWKERQTLANANNFVFTTVLALATTVLVVPSTANYNQVLLVPALLIVAGEARAIWRSGGASRALLVLTIGVVVWPWISSLVLAGSSYLFREEAVERGWALPFWTAIQTPLVVTALTLVHYYQSRFTPSPKPGSS